MRKLHPLFMYLLVFFLNWPAVLVWLYFLVSDDRIPPQLRYRIVSTYWVAVGSAFVLVAVLVFFLFFGTPSAGSWAPVIATVSPAAVTFVTGVIVIILLDRAISANFAKPWNYADAVIVIALSISFFISLPYLQYKFNRLPSVVDRG
jgi:hypothetical protein